MHLAPVIPISAKPVLYYSTMAAFGETILLRDFYFTEIPPLFGKI
jgi:hypothetical protein